MKKEMKKDFYKSKLQNDMYRQIFTPDEQNYLVSIPPNFYGCKVEVIVFQTNEDIIQPKVKPRSNWAIAAKQMHQTGDDHLLMPTLSKNENLDWWTWEG